MNWYQEQKFATSPAAIQKLMQFVQSLGGWQMAIRLLKTPDNQLVANKTEWQPHGINRLFTRLKKQILITLLATAVGVSLEQVTHDPFTYVNRLTQNEMVEDPNAYLNSDARITTNDTPQHNVQWDQFTGTDKY